MINPFKNKGFRAFVWKGAISVFIIFLVQYLTQKFLTSTALFREHLDIPQAFQLGKGVIFLSIMNSIIFGLVVFVILSRKSILDMKHSKFEAKQMLWFLLSAFFVILHFYLKYLINSNLEFFSHMPLFWAIVKVFIQVLFAITVIIGVYGFVFVKNFINKYRKEIAITLIVTVLFFILMMLVQNLWTLFSGALSKILFWIFSIFFDNVTYKPHVVSFTMEEGGGPLLGINNFRAIVGKPCSGIDSFLLFTSLYALIVLLDHKKIHKVKALWVYVIGIVGMFLTNVLRIMLLFIVGAYVDPDLAIGLFHTNAGWILFIGYFFIFWSMVSRYIYKGGNK
jgi:exosortase/archaeosortase family protein